MSARDLIPFRFEKHDIRVVYVAGEPMFVGKDVCDALGHTNASKAMGDHCKGVTKRYPLLTAGGMQELRVLTEADVLRLIVNSALPSAQAFERWVFEEVLPSIRKTGSYSMPGALAPAIDPLAALPPEQRALIALMVDNAGIKARQEEQAREQAAQAQVLETQAAELEKVGQQVKEIADGQVFKVCPSNAEPMTTIATRINKKYGLPRWVIDKVVRQMPCSPKPAGPVLNTHVSGNQPALLT